MGGLKSIESLGGSVLLILGLLLLLGIDVPDLRLLLPIPLHLLLARPILCTRAITRYSRPRDGYRGTSLIRKRPLPLRTTIDP